MKLKTWLPIAVALVLGTFAAVLAKKAMSGNDPPAAAVKIVVATRNIAPGESLTGDDLQLRAIAEETAPRGTQAEPSTLVGRTAAAQIASGQPVLESLLAAQGSGGASSAGSGGHAGDDDRGERVQRGGRDDHAGSAR